MVGEPFHFEDDGRVAGRTGLPDDLVPGIRQRLVSVERPGDRYRVFRNEELDGERPPGLPLARQAVAIER